MEPRDLFQAFLRLRTQSVISCPFKRSEDLRLKFKPSQTGIFPPTKKKTQPHAAVESIPVHLWPPPAERVEAGGEEGAVSSCRHCSNLTIWGNPWEWGGREPVIILHVVWPQLWLIFEEDKSSPASGQAGGGSEEGIEGKLD